jgi:hypothetical protein
VPSEDIFSTMTEMEEEFYLTQNLASACAQMCISLHILSRLHGLLGVGVYIKALNKEL